MARKKKTSKDTSSFKLVDRDYRVMAHFAKCGPLTARQICFQHFNPTVIRVYDEDYPGEGIVKETKTVTHQNCQTRLRHLENAGFIKRIETYVLLSNGKESYIYVLTRKGAEEVAAYLNKSISEIGWREREPRVRHNYISHHIRIYDYGLALERATQPFNSMSDITLVRWLNEVELTKIHSQFKVPLYDNQGNVVEEVRFFPDACAVLRGLDGKERYVIIEADTGTETISSKNDAYRTIQKKLSVYMSFLSRRQKALTTPSLFEEHYAGIKEKTVETIPVRVLTITEGEERCKRLVEAAEEIGAGRIFWFTDHDKIVTPRIVDTGKRKYSERWQREQEVYEAILPNILTDPMWFIAKDSDSTRPLHALDEPFRRALQR
jgi:DNA-binding Lrp family transcriptional regulator